MLQMKDLRSFCRIAENKINAKGIGDYDVIDVDFMTHRVIFRILPKDSDRTTVIEVEHDIDNVTNTKLEDFR